MIINFIRHGKTAGNLVKRYIGRTDEPLCEAGIAELKNTAYPGCDLVISSPMKRCTETAGIIYPSGRIVVYDDLRECDFGDFEGRNHTELSGNEAYQKWLDAGGMGAFPNGEDSADFRERSIRAFLDAVGDNKTFSTISFVVHGGTIMSVLEKFAVPHKEFYEYMTENGHGHVTVFDGEIIEITGKI